MTAVLSAISAVISLAEIGLGVMPVTSSSCGPWLMQPATRPTIPTMHSRDNLGTRLTPQHLQRAAHLLQRSGIVGTTFAQLGNDFRRRTLQELVVTELLVDLLDLAVQAFRLFLQPRLFDRDIDRSSQRQDDRHLVQGDPRRGLG